MASVLGGFLTRGSVYSVIGSDFVVEGGEGGVLARRALIAAPLATPTALLFDRVPDELEALDQVPEDVVDLHDDEFYHERNAQEKALNVAPSRRDASLLLVLIFTRHLFSVSVFIIKEILIINQLYNKSGS